MLEQGEGDLTVLARRYEWDLDGLWQALLAWVDAQPRSIKTQPRLSDSLQQLLKQAWLVASLEGAKQIRSAHLISAIIEQPKLLQCDGLWPLLSIGQAQLSRLRPLLDAQSDEREELQQNEPQEAYIASLDDEASDAASDGELSPALQNALDKFTQDITANAEQNKIDPIFGRDNEIRQMVDVLSRRRKNNPILVGEPGVGKTALVEGLALRIVQGNVPESLKPVRLHTLDLGLLQAGAGVKGEFEQRLKNVISAVQSSTTPILLFIDEAHTIIGAGNQVGGADAANLLKPALARGELRTIAATTWGEYKQYFEKDAALERRFQVIKVDEPDDETACLMLRGLKSRYAKYHGVHITDDAVRSAVTLARRYITGRQLPDKAVDLLDTAAARVRMSLDTLPEELTQLNAECTALELEAQALIDDAKLVGLSQDDKLDNIAKQLKEKQQQYQELEAHFHVDVEPRTVANVISDWTGVPLSSLMKDEQTELLQLELHLTQRVVGQDQALYAIAQRLRAAKTGLTSENGPQSVFLLVGTSGVGKTETALALADLLYGGEKSLITINLSEYQEPHTVSQLKGSPPGYVGYGQGGILTEAVRKRPYSVVLLDEVEKAHRDVLNLFYQVFDRGFMRDGEGREIDFRNTVILMTSNLGSDLIMQAFESHAAQLEEQALSDKTEHDETINDVNDEVGEINEPTDSELQELLRPVLLEHFKPALFARFQTVIYRPLDRDAMRQIVAMKLAQVGQRLSRHYNMTVNFNHDLYDVLTSACLLPDSGARNIDSLLNQQILPVLSQQLLERSAHKVMPTHLSLCWLG
ncbi:UNVERIFIED_CONTAM: hypothetical protein GTU68_067192 [Idotea baltica]|nr:hypothetical protein [Idotea baltica]